MQPNIPNSEATMKRTLASLVAASCVEFRGAPKTGWYYVKETK